MRKVRKSVDLLDIAECKISPPRQIDWNPRSPDRKRSQIATSQKKPDRINTTFIVEFCPSQIGRNPPDRQAPDRARSSKKPDRQIGTVRSAPDHFRLASGLDCSLIVLIRSMTADVVISSGSDARRWAAAGRGAKVKK